MRTYVQVGILFGSNRNLLVGIRLFTREVNFGLIRPTEVSRNKTEVFTDE